MKSLKSFQKMKRISSLVSSVIVAFSISNFAHAEVKFEQQYKVTDLGLYFNGTQTKGTSPNKNNPDVMDYAFGPRISAHGDAIKVYDDFIFTTWYKGGKTARNLMLSRYNTKTGVVKTIQFPHKHTGYRGDVLVGESHNTAAVGISPKDGKIHILYDMHSYNNTQFPNDYFRYSYSKKNAATVADSEFKLDLFIADGANDYGHNNLNGSNDPSQFSDLTYPTFFLNEDNDLLFYMRTGGNDNGGYVFTKYNSSTGKWDKVTQFNHLNSASKSNNVDHNWGLYGEMKYVNGKLRTAFQTRSANKNDKYQYQNGIYYAYSDDQSGKTSWKTHKGKGFNIPFADPAPLKIYEPGDLVSATGKDEVYIVGGFDFTVTNKGDVHIVSLVKDKTTNKSVKLHSYKPAGAADFTHSTDFNGGSSLYTSGEYVYIIGLKSGRPFIQRAKGGTNNFTTVYEDKDGQSFAHGVLTINNGKVYYFLQENKYENYTDNGQTKKRLSTKMPLYVQVIDLDLPQETQPEPVDFTPPEGFTLAANPSQTVEVAGTMDIAFGSNGQFSYLYNQTEDVLCSREAFGDPVPGVAKKCFTKPVEIVEPINTDEFCSVADLTWSNAQDKFAQQCSDFVFDKCEAVMIDAQEWIVCSNKNPPIEFINLVNDNQSLIIEAEDYARAIDVSVGNKGEVYREGDVDIEATTDTGSGYQVGWISETDRLSYDLLVTNAGQYQLEMRLANTVADAKLAVKINDKEIFAGQSINNTQSNTTYETMIFDLGDLAVGSQEITFAFNADLKFNWFKIVAKQDDNNGGKEGDNSGTDPGKDPVYEYGQFEVDSYKIEVNEYTSMLDVEVKRVNGSDQTIELEYKLSDGSATAGQDYQLKTGVLTFAEGEISKWINIEILDDTEYELSQTFNIEFIRQSDEITGAIPQNIIVTILDDDEATMIGDFGFEFESISINEQEANNVVNILRTNGADGEVTLNVMLEHISTSHDDIQSVSTSVTFADQETQKNIEIQLNDDEEVENDESFKLSLSSLNGEILFTQESLLVTLISDDIALESVMFSKNELTLVEGESIDVQINRTAMSLNEMTYDLKINEQSTLTSSEFNLENNQITFLQNEKTTSFKLSINQDELNEDTEILKLEIVDTNSNEVLSTLIVNVNNVMNVTPVSSGIIEISGSEFEVMEDSGEIEIQLLRHSGLLSDVYVDVVISSNQAVEGEDYTWQDQSIVMLENQTTASIKLPILDDQSFEAEEILTLTIAISEQNNNDALIGEVKQAQIKIIDNDLAQKATLIKFADEKISINEGESQSIELIRQGNLSDVNQVEIQLQTTLQEGQDYQISNTAFEFAVDQNILSFDISALVDSAIDQNDAELQLMIIETEDFQVGGILIVDIINNEESSDVNQTPENSNTDDVANENAENSSGSIGIWWLCFMSILVFRKGLIRKI